MTDIETQTIIDPEYDQREADINPPSSRAEIEAIYEAPEEREPPIHPPSRQVPARRDGATSSPGLGSRTLDGLTILSPSGYRALADSLIFDRSLYQQFYDRCKLVAAAQMYGHKNPTTVACAALKGMSLGMSFMESLDRIKVIHGTPVIRGPAAINHIHERCAGAECRCEESTAVRAVWRMSRPGWVPKTYTFTWEQAERAGLTKNTLYSRYPERMLKWQCASEGVQEMFGDVLGGLYFQEEIEVLERKEEAQAASRSAQRQAPSPSPAPAPPTPAAQAESDPSPDHEAPQDAQAPAEEAGEEGHPSLVRMKELLLEIARAQAAKIGLNSDMAIEAIRKEVRNHAMSDLGIKLGKQKRLTLPQIEKMIKHLEAQCSSPS